MPFQWTEARERAAVLVAVGKDLNRDIAAQCGCVESTLYLWQRDPEFRKRVDECRTEIRAKVMEDGIANLSNRLERSNLRWAQVLQITEERGKDPAHQAVPGYTTGLLCHTIKVVGKGADSVVVDEFELDAALIREERELQQQAAKELGQWVEKSESTGNLIVLDC